MTPSEVRHALADAAQGVLPGDWTCYPGPPETVSFPAAVVVPRAPWIAASRFCDAEYSAGVTLLLPRAQGVGAMDQLDAWAEPVRKAIQDLAGVIWDGTDMGPMIAPGGVESYGATINVRVMP